MKNNILIAASSLTLTTAVFTSFVGCAGTGTNTPSVQKIAKIDQPSALPALPVEPASNAAAPAENPFSQAAFYVDPHYATKVDSSRALAPELAAEFEQVKNQPTALWLDRIEAVAQVPVWLKDAQAQGAARGEQTLPVFVVYNLPNRDCAAKASGGELRAEEDGEARYRSEFIDKTL